MFISMGLQATSFADGKVLSKMENTRREYLCLQNWSILITEFVVFQFLDTCFTVLLNINIECCANVTTQKSYEAIIYNLF